MSAAWLHQNQTSIADNKWEDLYIPRYIFGLYLQERINYLLELAVDKGLLEYTLLQAQVTDIKKHNGQYSLTAIDTTGTPLTIASTKVVLSIGSPAITSLSDFVQPKQPAAVCMIEDVYEPDMNHNIQRIYKHLNQSTDCRQNNVLIIGSNASALEVLFNLMDLPESSAIHKFYILSSSGNFPRKINEKSHLSGFQPTHLLSLKSKPAYTSRQILQAVKQDMEGAQKDNRDLDDTFVPISNTVIELLNELNPVQQKQFVCKYGVEIGKLQRRAGSDYLSVVEQLAAENKIEFVRGKFIRQSGTAASGFFEYQDSHTNTTRVLPAPVKVIVNCGGFQNLTQSMSAPFLRNLIKQGICEVNGSKRGLVVNAHFEANQNLYLMGPLLAGNIIGNYKVWHAESCPRIFSLTHQLAKCLMV